MTRRALRLRRVVIGTTVLVSGRFGLWHAGGREIRLPTTGAGRQKKRKKIGKEPKPPWAVPKEEIPSMEQIVPKLKIPSAWPRVRLFFTDLGRMKTSETLLFAGDVGAYFLRTMDIEPEYRDVFIRLVRVTQR